MGLPDGWNDFTKTGKILDNRFVCFKTPHRNTDWTPVHLMNANPNIGLVIDVNNSNKFYDPNQFQIFNVEYCKIYVPGHHVPAEKLVQMFCRRVDDYLKYAEPGKIIGVHCTHGVNRTGYLVCRYLINYRKYKPKDAIALFGEARGHDISRQNYIDHLLTFESQPRSDRGSRWS